MNRHARTIFCVITMMTSTKTRKRDVLYKLKKYDLALNDYAKAFELAPDKIDLLLYMAMMAKTMGKPKESEDYEKRYRELRDNS